MENKITVKVYTSAEHNAKKASFSFDVDTREQAISHAQQIIEAGYERKIDEDTVEYFPPHVIERIEIVGSNLNRGVVDTDISS